jgi:hypothetical protein
MGGLEKGSGFGVQGSGWERREKGTVFGVQGSGCEREERGTGFGVQCRILLLNPEP